MYVPAKRFIDSKKSFDNRNNMMEHDVYEGSYLHQATACLFVVIASFPIQTVPGPSGSELG